MLTRLSFCYIRWYGHGRSSQLGSKSMALFQGESLNNAVRIDNRFRRFLPHQQAPI